MEHFRHVLAEPNQERWLWFRLQGERATWPKIAMIRSHTRISETLTDCVERLRRQRARRREDHMRLVTTPATPGAAAPGTAAPGVATPGTPAPRPAGSVQ
jgi:NTE family protein